MGSRSRINWIARPRLKQGSRSSAVWVQGNSQVGFYELGQAGFKVMAKLGSKYWSG